MERKFIVLPWEISQTCGNIMYEAWLKQIYCEKSAEAIVQQYDHCWKG
jgi:hypothetical protein